jgi:hypothetical protein
MFERLHVCPGDVSATSSDVEVQSLTADLGEGRALNSERNLSEEEEHGDPTGAPVEVLDYEGRHREGHEERGEAGVEPPPSARRGFQTQRLPPLTPSPGSGSRATDRRPPGMGRRAPPRTRPRPAARSLLASRRRLPASVAVGSSCGVRSFRRASSRFHDAGTVGHVRRGGVPGSGFVAGRVALLAREPSRQPSGSFRLVGGAPRDWRTTPPPAPGKAFAAHPEACPLPPGGCLRTCP